jgi:protein involved in sex pheromone biosynthesis
MSPTEILKRYCSGQRASCRVCSGTRAKTWRKTESQNFVYLSDDVNEYSANSSNNFADIRSNITEHVASLVASEVVSEANYEGTGGEGS